MRERKPKPWHKAERCYTADCDNPVKIKVAFFEENGLPAGHRFYCLDCVEGYFKREIKFDGGFHKTVEGRHVSFYKDDGFAFGWQLRPDPDNHVYYFRHEKYRK